MLVAGLAPAAHGGNRTGRVFTGDRSGDWLFGAMHRAGFANQATSTARDDGLELRDAYVAAAVRCAPPDNKPTTDERDRCLPYLTARARAARRGAGDRGARRVRLRRGRTCARRDGRAAARARGRSSATAWRSRPARATVLGCYHPSQQNTFTGRLTEPMLDAVFERARELADGSSLSAMTDGCSRGSTSR